MYTLFGPKIFPAFSGLVLASNQFLCLGLSLWVPAGFWRAKIHYFTNLRESKLTVNETDCKIKGSIKYQTK